MSICESCAGAGRAALPAGAWKRAAWLLAALLQAAPTLIVPLPAMAASQASAAAAPQPPAAPAPPPTPPQPYDGQLLRLSEILGSLSYLGSICEPGQKDPYRSQMQALLEAEATASPRREEYAGAFNRGYRGLANIYARCTENARALAGRFKVEGVTITRQVRKMYGG